jgi:hypothetical protein
LVIQTVSADEKADIEYNKNALMLGLLMREFLPRLVFSYQTDCTLTFQNENQMFKSSINEGRIEFGLEIPKGINTFHSNGYNNSLSLPFFLRQFTYKIYKICTVTKG